MATEIERKFLVRGEGWRALAYARRRMEQGYLCGDGPASVRVRIDDETANLNIKAAVVGAARAEYEYAIPLPEAREILDSLTLAEPIRKTRHLVEHAGHIWEVDEFDGANAPLVVAEIELSDIDEAFATPDWLGAEVTQDKRYYNHALAFEPYSRWTI